MVSLVARSLQCRAAHGQTPHVPSGPTSRLSLCTKQRAKSTPFSERTRAEMGRAVIDSDPQLDNPAKFGGMAGAALSHLSSSVQVKFTGCRAALQGCLPQLQPCSSPHNQK